MCCGEPALEFSSGDRLLAEIGVHYGSSLRLDGWPADATLTGPSAEFVCASLLQRNVVGPDGEFNARTPEERIIRRYARFIGSRLAREGPLMDAEAFDAALSAQSSAARSRSVCSGGRSRSVEPSIAAARDSSVASVRPAGSSVSGAGRWFGLETARDSSIERIAVGSAVRIEPVDPDLSYLRGRGVGPPRVAATAAGSRPPSWR